MNRYLPPGTILFVLAISCSIYDKPNGTYYGEVFAVLLLIYFGLFIAAIIRWNLRYSDSLYLRSFKDGMEVQKYLGKIVEYPGKTAHRVFLQQSPFTPRVEIQLGEGNDVYQYYDVEIKMKIGSQVLSFICGNLTKHERDLTPKKNAQNSPSLQTQPLPLPDSISSQPQPNTDSLPTTRNLNRFKLLPKVSKKETYYVFKPVLLAKNYEEILFAAADILTRLNERIVREQNRHLEILEQNSRIFTEQELASRTGRAINAHCPDLHLTILFGPHYIAHEGVGLRQGGVEYGTHYGNYPNQPPARSPIESPRGDSTDIF